MLLILSTNMRILPELIEFGIEEKEGKIYLAALEIGIGSVANIAKKARINRATTYYILERLKGKGLITESIQKKKRQFVAASPDKLGDLIERRRKMLDRILPMLRGLENNNEKKPKIEYFEGAEGMVQLWLDNLTADGEILTVAGPNTYILRHVPDYIEQRVKKKIMLKMIVPDTAEMRRMKENDPSSLRLMKLVPRDLYPFKIHIDMYNDKVAIISFEEEIGLLIQSRDTTDTMRSFFQLAWNGIQ